MAKKTPERLIRVCLHGPESSGKSTLARRLADHFAAPLVPEYLRHFVDKKGAPCALADMPRIIEGQLAWQALAAAKATSLVILDTDFLTTKIYHELYFGETPPWLDSFTLSPADLYLMCHPDTPWVADGQRDMPHRRQELANIFRLELEARGLRFVDIRGDDLEARVQQAVAAVSSIW